jgi:hypothetical protein
MMGSMDFWIIGSSVTLVVAQGVWNPELLPSCFPYGHSGPCEKPSKNPNEFAKIQVNPTKSDQIKPLFLFQLLTPKFWLLNSGGTDREDSRPTKGAARFRGNSLILSKVKITKRTQFKNRPTRHPRPLRMTT